MSLLEFVGKEALFADQPYRPDALRTVWGEVSSLPVSDQPLNLSEHTKALQGTFVLLEA